MFLFLKDRSLFERCKWLKAKQLLTISGKKIRYYIPASKCVVSKDASGLSWDAVSFVFILILLRVYKSWYFQHIVADLKVDSQLSSRYCP